MGYKGNSWKCLEKIIAYGHDRGKIFCDWLDIMLLTQLSLADNFKRKNFSLLKFNGEFEQEYMKYVESYGKEKMELFAQAYGHLLLELKQNPDPLGDMYEKEITFGERGQYFTPWHICEMMTRMNEIKDNDRVLDPACGSGRMLLAGAKINPNAFFVGKDIDLRCVKICTLNMHFRNLTGMTRWEDSLSGKVYGTYHINNGFVSVV